MNWESIRATILQQTDASLCGSRAPSLFDSASSEGDASSRVARELSMKSQSRLSRESERSSELDLFRDRENYRDVRLCSLEREVQDLREALRSVTRQVDAQTLSA
eukprot:1984644-Prorocentrum_lima.AAC.1